MPGLEQELREAVADRYAIDRELGMGGMATVYLARDLRHDRDVAVKVLKQELAAAVGSERFLREIKITAQLNHPHILPLLDSGEVAGFLYYVLPYVAGGSLRHRLTRERRLSLPDVIRITEQVASALDYAHRHGVIHRDVKPENILFSEGHAIVADFGIAKAVSTVSRDQLTRSGFPLGTPGYMSPEQASGQTVLRPQADVCSLGCVVYEMVVGETPGVWPTPDEVRLGRFAETLPGHRELLDALPGRIEQALVKALAIRSGERFATPIEFADALTEASRGSGKLTEGSSRALLERAVQLDAEVGTESGALSLGGVEQVAAQVGVSPDRVRRAAHDLQQRPHAPPPQLLREPSRSKKDLTVIEWTVEGELPAAAHDRLVEEIQATLGVAGHATQLGSSLTWSPVTGAESGERLVVTVSARSGVTRIRIEEKYSLTDWRLFAPGFAAAGGALTMAVLFAGVLGMVDNAAVLIPMAMGGVSGGVLSAHGLLKAMSKNRRSLLESLADRMTDIATQSISGARGTEDSAMERPRLRS